MGAKIQSWREKLFICLLSKDKNIFSTGESIGFLREEVRTSEDKFEPNSDKYELALAVYLGMESQVLGIG
ncbi:MAG: hypothetical protein JRF62_11830 [Deltaproteobacteria bacterium]|nr:hypothetical protein [Deltaproteobacteria bacterium]MBW2247850.1 hypothetical protein [Deltaproteobacteria bacterium]MBW2597583.1 hypothetical protein [Deltaproteobacteria bacterium]MBW2640427.1 hypothetical protein [Deltaproteobacteria bacterium]MBW2681171.1 hypothetical protein [Deltaproteobacteria bacterium]